MDGTYCCVSWPICASQFQASDGQSGTPKGAKLCLQAVSTAPDLAPAHELLGVLFFGALDDYSRARHHLERSYRLYRRASDLRGSVRSAIALAQVDATSGNRPGVQGWLARAGRWVR